MRPAAGDPVAAGVVAFVPPVRVLVLGGADRLRFLQALVAQDLAGLAPGDGVHGALTDDRGRPIADFHLFVLPEAVLLELPAGRADEARAALDARIIADDVRTAWADGGVVAYEAGDPARLAAALGVAGDAVASPAPGVTFAAAGGFADGDEALEDEAVLATVPAARHAVLRASRLGGYGALRWADGDRMAELAAAAGPGVTLALSATQLDPLEIAAGRIAAAELAEAKVWNELAVMSAVSLTKGCWMGQEIVRRVHVLGETRRLLRGVRLETPHGVGWAGATLEDAAGAAAGTVTRAARAPFLGATIGLAFVRREALPGATLTARRADGAAAAATVHALPFVARRPADAPEPAWIPRENP